MNINVEFQMVCDDCRSLTIKIENPEGASRETVVYCGRCGAHEGHGRVERPSRPRAKSACCAAWGTACECYCGHACWNAPTA